MPESGRLTGTVLIYGLSEAISRGISFAMFPVLTHLFTSTDFGRISMLASLGALAGLIANSGLANAAHRYYLDVQATEGSRKIIVSAGFILMLLLSLIVVLASASFLFALMGRVVEQDVVELALVVLITVIPAQLLQYSQDVIRLHSTPWKYFFLSVAKSVLGLIFGIVLVIGLKLGAWGYFLGLFFGQLVLLPWGMVLIRNELSVRLEREVALQMLKYGYPFIFAGLGQWVISSADLFILGQLRGSSEVGIYSAALRVTMIIMFVTTAFSLAWAPSALRLHAEHPEYRRVVGDMLPRIGGILIYVAAAVSIFGKELISWLTPPEYHSAVMPLCFLSMAAAISGTVQVTVLGLAFERRSDLIAKAVWFCAIIGIGVSYLLTWQFGLMGTAVANLITTFMLTSSYMYLTQQIHPLIINHVLLGRMLVLGALVLTSAVLWTSVEAGVSSFLAKLASLLVVLVVGHRIGFQLPYSGFRNGYAAMRESFGKKDMR